MRVEASPHESVAGPQIGREADDSSVLAAAEALAYELAEHGPARIEDDLARFVPAAERLGADARLGSIVLDRRRPDVVRQRAFGTMHNQVARLIGEASRSAGGR